MGERLILHILNLHFPFQIHTLLSHKLRLKTYTYEKNYLSLSVLVMGFGVLSAQELGSIPAIRPDSCDVVLSAKRPASVDSNFIKFNDGRVQYTPFTVRKARVLRPGALVLQDNSEVFFTEITAYANSEGYFRVKITEQFLKITEKIYKRTVQGAIDLYEIDEIESTPSSFMTTAPGRAPIITGGNRKKGKKFLCDHKKQ